MRAALLLMLLAVPARAEEEPPSVLSDDVTYCSHLVRRLSARAGAERDGEAMALAREGQKLCGEGHVRPGVLRLRRAMVLLDQGG